jgi:hypothetical protein
MASGTVELPAARSLASSSTSHHGDAPPKIIGRKRAKAIARQPSIELYVEDKRHPSLAGTYLAACTAYAALQGKSPVGLPYTAGLPADTVALLQNAAWDATREYFKR